MFPRHRRSFPQQGFGANLRFAFGQLRIHTGASKSSVVTNDFLVAIQIVVTSRAYHITD